MKKTRLLGGITTIIKEPPREEIALAMFRKMSKNRKLGARAARDKSKIVDEMAPRVALPLHFSIFLCLQIGQVIRRLKYDMNVDHRKVEILKRINLAKTVKIA